MTTQAFVGAGVDSPPNGNGHAVVQDEAQRVAPSALADIESELLAEVTERSVTLAVPGRPGWSVRYRAEVSSAELNEWRRRAKDPKGPGGIDIGLFARLVLASKCHALARHGVDVPESAEDATPRTFQSPSMRTLYATGRAIDVVLAFYGGHDRDADISTASEEVMRAAGWGSDGSDQVDPFEPPASD